MLGIGLLRINVRRLAVCACTCVKIGTDSSWAISNHINVESKFCYNVVTDFATVKVRNCLMKQLYNVSHCRAPQEVMVMLMAVSNTLLLLVSVCCYCMHVME